MDNEIRCEIRLEEADGKRPRLVGTLLPFNEVAKDRRELFEAGSLTWDERGIIVNRMHQRSSPIMRVVPVEANGRLTIDSPIPDTVAGRDCESEVRSGLLSSMSIEFRAVHERLVGGVRHLVKAVLTGAAVCDSGAYESATVEARVKAAKDRDEWQAWRIEVIT